MASLPNSSALLSSPPLPVRVELGPDQPHRRRILRSWFAPRPIRVAILLAAVGLLNAFDLLFTIIADRLGHFTELNPVAAEVLDTGNYLILALYKTTFIGVGICILWRLRTYRLSEMACWLATFVYAMVAMRWHYYYEIWAFCIHA